MRRTLRRLLWLIPIAAVIGTGIWLATGAPIDADRLKAELQRGIKRATGRDAAIDGPLHVTIGLSPSITAEGIRLANAPGGSAPNMLTAQSLRAQVALLPLLGGHVVLEDVTLSQADVLVENDADGRLNWQFQPQHRALYQGSDVPAATHGGGGLDVHRVRIEGGRLTWRLTPGRVIAVDLDTATVVAESPDAPMRAGLHGHMGGVPIGLTAESGSFARLQGGPVTALAGAWVLDVSATAGAALLKLDGGVNHPDEWRGYSFLLTANAPDLAPFAPWLPRWLALPLRDVNLTTRLTDGMNGTFRTTALSLHAGESDLSTAVPGLQLKEALLSAPGPGQQGQLTVNGTFQGTPLRMVGTTTQPDIMAADTPLPITFSAEAASASLSARGTIPPAPNGNGLDLTIDVRVPSLSDLAPLARRPLPDIRGLNFGAHVGDAGFRLRGLNFRDLALESSVGDLAGNVTVAWSPVIALNGTLTGRQVDMDAVAAAYAMLTVPMPSADIPPSSPATPPSPGDAPSPPPPSAGDTAPRLIPDDPLPFDALRGADGNLTLSLSRMIAGGETYREVQAKLTATGGRVVVNPLRMTAPQGILIGGLTIDASADPPQVALNLRAPALAAAKIVSLLGYPGGANGALQVDAQLTAIGASPRALAAALNGHLGLTLVNGSVSDAVLQTMLGGALSKAGVPSFGGDVPVRCFASRVDFRSGAGDVQALALDTPQLVLTGGGTIDLASETVALHLRPAVRIGGTGVAAPVSLSGGFGDMKAALDPVLGGRVGFTIGGPAPSGESCTGKLALARGGMPGPMPVAAKLQGLGPIRKPTDLLRGLFH